MDEVQYARDWRAICQEANLFAQRRCAELADEYTKLLVQIAGILLAFTGISADDFPTEGPGLFELQVVYATAISMFVLSLIMGLLHIKRKEKWWDGFVTQRSRRVEGWDQAVNGEKTLKEAQTHMDGTGPGKGQISYSPLWTWIMQTIFLAIGGSLLFILFLVFIFSPSY